ncbi:hypothetical protein V6U89_11900 [Micromonospora sp. CPCC 206171]|uniref:hypothetical protein n=1 Tax=Micromonospora sp. CPCC 206171 TaxID=3122405 RepID=UPI002FF319A5
MDKVTWLDVITVVIALGGVVVAALSWVVSRGSRDEARRSADAAEVSAKAAQDSAREAAAVAAIERDRDHDRLGPGPVPDIAPKLETNPRNSGLPDTLFGTVTVPRDYRVRGFAVRGNSSSPIGLDLLLHAGRPYRFAIEQWPKDRMEPVAEYVLFRFWPPAEVDDVDAWRCPCDRPQADGNEWTPGHWEWRAPVQYRRPPAPMIAYR